MEGAPRRALQAPRPSPHGSARSLVWPGRSADISRGFLARPASRDGGCRGLHGMRSRSLERPVASVGIRCMEGLRSAPPFGRRPWSTNGVPTPTCSCAPSPPPGDDGVSCGGVLRADVRGLLRPSLGRLYLRRRPQQQLGFAAANFFPFVAATADGLPRSSAIWAARSVFSQENSLRPKWP